MEIGKELRQLRREADISQAALAIELNCTQSFISQYESGAKLVPDSREKEIRKAITKLTKKRRK